MMLTKDIYTILASDIFEWRIQLADENHPVFRAHFENNPLLPAFLQIDIFAELIGKKVTKIERCKFIHPIRPNETLVYRIARQEDDFYKVELLSRSRTSSEFKIICKPLQKESIE